MTLRVPRNALPPRSSAGEPGTDNAGAKGSGAPPIKIKKYANRRLYNTSTSSYVTLDHLCQMVKDGEDFVVTDAKTGEDITRSVLTQIIVEEEAKGEHLLPIGFLRQLISLYGSNMELLVPNYLEYSMKAFARNQEKMRETLESTMSGMFPGMAAWEEMGKQNMAMFENALRMFTPFGGAGGSPPPDSSAAEDQPGADKTPASKGSGEADKGNDIEALQRKLDELQQQLQSLGQQKKR